ncbi:hypothetical protein EDD90_2815 [Streptomyces sp. Ag109_O5-1]|uniref:hypothetical protein n=1 Tax=Streptomyces sp. Ag109_O5-1 TaxID=1938851 RepID=UPI000F4F880D|nr:hypothetical protein [Streptomyces sp. Ag109_O5-1]RPE39797.1 hypothetical protein EDD90_2815 [Streptomyces sp. Ag109_O5-1]
MNRYSADRLAALRLIADGGVKVYEFAATGQLRVVAPGTGATIRPHTFRALDRNGLVHRDTSTAADEGQALSLTDAGRDALAVATPAPERLRIELVVHRAPDGETATTWFVNGRPLAEADVDVTEYHVDPGANGTGPEWVAEREKAAGRASDAAAARIRELVGYYA